MFVFWLFRGANLFWVIILLMALQSVCFGVFFFLKWYVKCSVKWFVWLVFVGDFNMFFVCFLFHGCFLWNIDS